MYNGDIMKKVDFIKMRVISSREIVYTFKHWPTQEIDGVEFLSVCKREPSQELTQVSHWMRKDSLERVK